MAMVRELMDGELLNTAFAVFAPDGQTRLTTKARSVRLAFGRRSTETGLLQIARRYPGRDLDDPPLTPDFSSVREAVNIAACDERPLVIAWGKDENDRKAIEAQLRALAWSSEFVGRVHWDLSVGEGFRDYVPNGTAGTRGVIIVQPEPYGRTAQVIGAIDLDLTLKDQQWVLRNAVERFERSFEKLPYEEHVEKGKTLGVVWKEAIRMGDRPMDPNRRGRNR
jgi:hypothetical protein